jgi:Do/DeqQ family serine protease
MLESVTASVVSIRVTKTMPTSSRYFFNGDQLPDEVRRYFQDIPNFNREGTRRPYTTGAGSGVIVDAERGYVITNHHVIDGAANINVQLSDGRAMQAVLLGSDENTDVALLQIEADDLVDIEFADIDTVQVGDYVVAIGNPFGIGQTVTAGIVSALGRTGLNNNNYEDFIQTDAAINLGNSGGALVDMEGRMIGINSAIISGNGGSNGIGFAVPADMVSAVMEHLERDGEVRRGLLGVTITDVTPDVQATLDVSVETGALVTSVMPDSAADQAGIQISDVIVQIDGRSVGGSRELRNIVGLMRRDQQVELVLYREGERLTLDANIGAADGGRATGAGRPALSSEYRGAQLRSLASNSNSAAQTGVEVVSVQAQSRARAAGLRPGDVIIEVNRRPIADLPAFNSAVENLDQIAALTVLREDRRMLLFLS